MRTSCVLIPAVVAILTALLNAQTPKDRYKDRYNVSPPVARADILIAQRARGILNSPARWNRADTRVCRVKQCKNGCPMKAETFSLYCALEKATDEVTGAFDHRGAAMQEARFVIDEIATNRKDFQHRLQGYNNDPTTTFADIQKVLRLLEDRLQQAVQGCCVADKH